MENEEIVAVSQINDEFSLISLFFRADIFVKLEQIPIKRIVTNPEGAVVARIGQNEVLGIARHSESRQGLVIYREVDKESPKTWARPLKMFLGDVEVGGKMIPRFVKQS